MRHVSCMGGWCTARESCRLYEPSDQAAPVDRLCTAGEHDSYEPVRIVRSAADSPHIGLVGPNSVFHMAAAA